MQKIRRAHLFELQKMRKNIVRDASDMLKLSIQKAIELMKEEITNLMS